MFFLEWLANAEGCKITREKEGERKNQGRVGIRLVRKNVRKLGCQGNI